MTIEESPEYFQALREASFDQLLQPLRERANQLTADILASLSDEDCRMVLKALASGDYIVVDRERFERLREFVSAQHEQDALRSLNRGPDFLDRTVHNAMVMRRREQAQTAIQPGDLDPLP